jgi:hypothetical protein
MSKILNLKGITTNDIQTAEQIMEQKLNEQFQVKSVTAIRNTYKPHPKYITITPPNSNDDQSDDPNTDLGWIKSTNIKCNTCLRTFNTMPLFMPTYIEMKSNKLEIGVEGNFCSYSCIITHIDIKFPNLSCGANQSKYKRMVYHLYKLFTGKVIKHIEPSPHYTCIDEYGGTMTASEYYKKIDTMNLHNNMSVTNYVIKPSQGLSNHEKIAGKSIKDILYTGMQSKTSTNIQDQMT